jgi:MarR family transcriptional regulator, organic hydroperoxide resistance regulator
MPQDPKQLLLDKQLCFSLYSASLAVTQGYKPLLEPLGLTYPQYLVMLVLWETDGLGLKEVADRLGQKPGALTPVIKRMELDGFLTRVRSLEDERYIQISLTEKGKSLQQGAREVNECIFQCSGMSREEIVELRDKLNRLKVNFKK